MADSSKLWVISLGDECEAIKPQVEQTEIKRTPLRPVAQVKRSVPKPQAQQISKPSGRLHFATKMALSYLLGPFALLLWAENGKKSPWSFVALFSGLGSIAIAWKWRSILEYSSSGSLLIPMLALAGVLSLLAFTSWARALQLAFTSRTRSHTAWPSWMRSAPGVTGLGFLAPGLGLYLAGSYKRAVATVWAFWPVSVAIVVIAHAGWTWQWLQNSVHSSASMEMFETMLIVAAGVIVLGLAGWLVQALAGLHRLTMFSRTAYSASGDRYAVALLLAVIALGVLSPSADMATFVNETGIRLHKEGFQLIPLQLTRSAQAMDPGEITYSIQLASLHQERGELEEAETVRQDLDQDYQAYLGMMGQQVSEQISEPDVAKSTAKVTRRKSKPRPQPRPDLGPERDALTGSLNFGPPAPATPAMQ